MYSGTQANWHICSEDRKTVSFHHLLQTGIHCSNTSRKSVNLLFILGQHRTMGAAGFGGSFAPIVQYEKWEIHPVFPRFPYFRSGQNLSPNLLAPLCGVALEYARRKNKDGCKKLGPGAFRDPVSVYQISFLRCLLAFATPLLHSRLRRSISSWEAASSFSFR